MPAFADIDNDGDLDYFCAIRNKTIYFYRNDGTPENPSWTFVTSYYGFIDVDDNISGMTFADIDNDSDFDMVVGSKLYRNDGTPDSASWADVGQICYCYWPAPTFVDIDKDDDIDLFSGGLGGNINFYRNDGTPDSASWTFVTDAYNSIDVGARSVPAFADIDNDGDPDMFVGGINGGINFWRNMGISNELSGSPLLSLPLNNSFINDTTPQLVWEVPSDADNDKLHFRVELSTTSDFATSVDTFESRFDTIGFSPTPPVNQGTDSCSYTLQSNLPEGSYWWRVSAYDGYEYGNTSSEWKFTILEVGVQEKEIPQIFFMTQNHPNPFTGATEIRYGLPKDSYVEITVYNLLGQKVATLIQGNRKAGYHSVNWNGKDNAGKRVAKGIYFYRMEVPINRDFAGSTGGFKATKKLTIIR